MPSAVLHWPFFRARTVPSSRTTGWLALVTCILAAGTYTPFAKILTGSLSPLTLFFLSEALTGFFVALSFGLMPVLRALAGHSKRTLLWIGAVGLLSGTTAPLMQFAGIRLSSAVNASFFGSMETFFMLILAVMLLREPLRRMHIMSAAVMVLGMLTIVFRGFTEGLTLQVGDGLLVASSATFAFGSIFFRKHLKRCEPHVVLFGRSIVAITCFFLASPFTQHPLISELKNLPVQVIPTLLAFGFLSRFLNIFSFYQSLDRLPVTIVSLFLNSSVVVAIGLAAFMLGEPLHAWHIAGGALIILGSILLEIRGLHSTEKHLERHLRHKNGHV